MYNHDDDNWEIQDSAFESLLENGCTLEDLLDQDTLIDEVKAQTSSLIELYC